MRESIEQMVARANAYGYIPTKKEVSVPMAQKVKLAKGKEFNFAKVSQASKYPWDEWFGGELLMIEKSKGTEDDKGTVVTVTDKKDYEVTTDAMPAKLKTAARRRYKVVQISKRDADGNRLKDALIFQARDMTQEERDAEDQLRAEEKAARAAKGETEEETTEEPQS